MKVMRVLVAWGSMILIGCVSLKAQEILPNGSFEDFSQGRPDAWRQPEPPFFHYTFGTKESPAEDGQFYNGLCVRNSMLNENLQVPLNHPLAKDSLYCFAMQWRVNPLQKNGLSNLKHMSLFFSEDSIYVKGTRLLSLPPQVDLSTAALNTEWSSVEGNYCARGGEAYMLLGAFAVPREITKTYQPEDFTNVDAYLAERFSQLDAQQEKEKEAFHHERDSLVAVVRNSMSEDPSSKKKNKKKKDNVDVRTLIGELNMKEQMLPQRFADQRKQVMQHLVDSLAGRLVGSDGNPGYDVRVEFDHLSLIPCADQGEIPVAIATPETFPAPEDGAIELRDVLFETAQATLVPTSVHSIDSLVHVLEQQPDWHVRLLGHTDIAGDERSNYDLSNRRAQAVADYMVTSGIAKDRISWVGYGNSRPKYPNDSSEHMRRNRRVEFILEK